MVLYAPYLLMVLAAVAWHLWRRHRRERAAAQEQAQNIAAGLNEPPSLHPVVQAALCIGSSSCVRRCPEGALGMVDGKAALINASACIGHGACHAACPFDAIQLVFGTATRGVDIPLLSAQFETNVAGLFIAGELGGMGLIRKAAEQGRQAMEAIARQLAGAAAPAAVTAAGAGEPLLDVLIVGAGPAGLSAGLSAIEQGLSYRVIEQESSLGGAIFHYPRQKVAMTAPVRLALLGEVKMNEISKEDLLAFWNGVVQTHGLRLDCGRRMERIEPLPADASGPSPGFAVHTAQGVLRARKVLLAIGRRGTPRTLDVPGEALPKVTYRLIDPQQYRGQHVLVVGGGDSALEAAIALADQPGTHVSLSYRSAAFSRVKAKNRDALAQRQAGGRLEVLLQSQVECITPEAARLRLADGQTREQPNQAVIICAGGVLPTPLLQAMGIRFETKHGTA